MLGAVVSLALGMALLPTPAWAEEPKPKPDQTKPAETKEEKPRRHYHLERLKREAEAKKAAEEEAARKAAEEEAAKKGQAPAPTAPTAPADAAPAPVAPAAPEKGKSAAPAAPPAPAPAPAPEKGKAAPPAAPAPAPPAPAPAPEKGKAAPPAAPAPAPAPPPASASGKPAAPAPAAPPPAEKPKKPKTPWSTYAASDGKYAWAEPSGWVLDEAHSVGGQAMSWNEPAGGPGTFRIVTYPKTGASLADLVKAASYGGTPKASKAWMVAEGQQGELKIAVAARVLESGDFLLLVLSAPAPSFKWLGGLSGVRLAANAVIGFKPRGADWQPAQ